MGPGTGILALADYLDLPELYKSYGDTNWDRLTNPNMLLDPAKMVGNTISDLVSFPVDLIGDIPAAAIDRFKSADYYNPFGEYAQEHGMNVNPETGEKTLIPGIDFQDFTTQLGRYELDAHPWNPMPSFYTDKEGGNPLDWDRTGKGVYEDISKMTDDHFDKEASYLDKDGDGVIDSIHDKLEENLPPYWKWAYDNPEKDREDYHDLHSKEYEKEYNKIFPKKKWNEFFDKKADEVFQFRYGIDNPYGFTFGKEQPWGGPGLREFNLGDVNIPFTDKDFPLQYGSFGDPIFKYSTPEAKDTYTKMNIAGEVLYGVPSALRWIGKKLARKADDVKPPKNAGRIEDKNRFRQAEEWLNQRGG